jgi:hypothetical protein
MLDALQTKAELLILIFSHQNQANDFTFYQSGRFLHNPQDQTPMVKEGFSSLSMISYQARATARSAQGKGAGCIFLGW